MKIEIKRRTLLVWSVIVLLLIGTLGVVVFAQGWRWHMAPVTAPEIAQLVQDKLAELQPLTVYLSPFGYAYVVPLVDRETRLIAHIAVDSRTGNVLANYASPAYSATVVEPTISKDDAFNTAKAEVESGLTVGQIYRNPRGWYIVEVKDNQGRVICTVQSDGQYVW